MAQKVSWYDNDVEYLEGPFVVCDMNGKCRLEVEFKGRKCPALPIQEVINFARSKYPQWEWYGTKLSSVELLCDSLNNDFKRGLLKFCESGCVVVA